MEFNVFIVIIRRRKFVFASIFLLTLLIPIFLSISKEPIYKASSSIIFQKIDPQTTFLEILPDSLSTISFFEAKDTRDNFLAILEDAANVQRTIIELGYEYSVDEFYTSSPFLKFLLSFQQQALSIEDVSGKEIFEVTGYATTTDEAVRISKKLVESAAVAWSVMRKNSSLKIKKTLGIRNYAVREKLAAAIDRKNAFTQQNNFIDFDSDLESIYSQISYNKQEKNRINLFVESVERQRKAIADKLKETVEYFDTRYETEVNYVVKKAKEKLAELLWDLASERTVLSKDHRVIIAIERKINEVKNTISKESQKMLSREVKGRNEYRDDLIKRYHDIYIDEITKNANLTVIERSIEEGIGEAKKLSRLSMENQLIQDEIMLYKSIISDIEKALEALSTVENIDVSGFSVLHFADESLESQDAYFPNYISIIFFGTFFSFWGAFISTLFADYIDPALKSTDRIESLLGISILSEIPNMKDWKKCFIRKKLINIPSADNSKMVRRMISWIKKGDRERNNHIIGLTSTRFSEGVTSLTLTVARRLAELGDKVLIVEGNVIMPCLKDILMADSTFGITDLLDGKKGFSDCVIDIGPNLAALLVQNNVKDSFFLNRHFVRDLHDSIPEGEQFNWIIIDLPGIEEDMVVGEIINHCDSALFTIAPWVVTPYEVEKALAQLKSSNSLYEDIAFVANLQRNCCWKGAIEKL